MKKIIILSLFLTASVLASDRDFREDCVLGLIEIIPIKTRRQEEIPLRKIEELIQKHDYISRTYADRFCAQKDLLKEVLRPTLLRNFGRLQSIEKTEEDEKTDKIVEVIKRTISFIYDQVDREIREHRRIFGY